MTTAWPKGTRGRFYDDHDRMIMDSTPTLVTLLRPWIRPFTMIIYTGWLRSSYKFLWEEVKRQLENLENGQLQEAGADSPKG